MKILILNLTLDSRETHEFYFRIDNIYLLINTFYPQEFTNTLKATFEKWNFTIMSIT